MSLNDVAAEVHKRTGHRPSRATVCRWCRLGLKRPGGRVVKLNASRFGGLWLTSSEALEAFIAELNAG